MPVYTISVDREEFLHLYRAALDRGCSLSHLLREALYDYLELEAPEVRFPRFTRLPDPMLAHRSNGRVIMLGVYLPEETLPLIKQAQEKTRLSRRQTLRRVLLSYLTKLGYGPFDMRSPGRRSHRSRSKD